jgi:hypothetical protein
MCGLVAVDHEMSLGINRRSDAVVFQRPGALNLCIGGVLSCCNQYRISILLKRPCIHVFMDKRCLFE